MSTVNEIGCEGGRTVTIMSWNVNGFPKKKTAVLNHLKILQADIVFLQETHIGTNKDNPLSTLTVEPKLSADYLGIFTKYKANSRGVGVLIRNNMGVEGVRISEDAKGRYIVIYCTISGEEFVFINIYNPKDEKIDFVGNSDISFTNPKSGNLIIGGDFNTVLETHFDKTSGIKNRTHIDMLKSLRVFLEKAKLIDLWRSLYPDAKSFTYFGDSKKGKSRLDYFFVPIEVLSRMRGCKIHDRPQHAGRQEYISDHAPISMKIRIDNSRWQFNTAVLEQTSVVHLSATIQNFSRRAIRRKADEWPCLKARLSIEAVSCENIIRGEQPECKRLKQDATFSSTTIAKNVSEGTAHRLMVLQKQTEYGGSTLMNEGFPLAPQQRKKSDLMMFLDRLHNRGKSEEIDSILNAILGEGISKKEILTVILSLCDSDEPRPDGLPVKFYQYFSHQLLDYLQIFFNKLLNTKAVTLNFSESFIIDASAPIDHSYCKGLLEQIQVFNCDYEILTCILAERLHSVIDFQNPGQHSAHHHIQEAKVSKIPTIAVRLKLNPHIPNWSYLVQRLQYHKIPEGFQTVLKILLNGHDNGFDSQERGLRPGCPLTFILVQICLHSLIQTINREETVQSVDKFRDSDRMRAPMDSDKAVFFIPNQCQTVEAFEELLMSFLSNSGLLVDHRCAEILSIGLSETLVYLNVLKGFKNVSGFWCHGMFID